MPAPQSRYRQPKQLDAGGFQPEISSFRLCLAAEGKACRTVRTYTEAVAWFAAAHLRGETDLTSWEEVGKQDISGGLPGCWTGTAARTPATSTVPCSSSSSGWPPRKRSSTPWPG